MWDTSTKQTPLDTEDMEDMEDMSLSNTTPPLTPPWALSSPATTTTSGASGNNDNDSRYFFGDSYNCDVGDGGGDDGFEKSGSGVLDRPSLQLLGDADGASMDEISEVCCSNRPDSQEDMGGLMRRKGNMQGWGGGRTGCSHAACYPQTAATSIFLSWCFGKGCRCTIYTDTDLSGISADFFMAGN